MLKRSSKVVVTRPYGKGDVILSALIHRLQRLGPSFNWRPWSRPGAAAAEAKQD